MKNIFYLFSVILCSVLVLCAQGCSKAAGQASQGISPATIEISPAKSSIANGLTLQLAAMVKSAGTATQDLTASLKWSSSDTNIADVSNDAGSIGLVTSKNEGTITITATDPDNGESGETSVTVTAAALVSLVVTPADASIAVNTQQQFAATGIFTDDSSRNLTAEVSWTSSDNNVVSISDMTGSKGLASGSTAGKATIYAVYSPTEGVEAHTSLTVTSAGFALSLAGTYSQGNQFFRSMNLVDLNNDNYLDIVAGNNTANDSIVLLNNADGTGTFTVSTQTLGTSAIFNFATADVDGDGYADIFFGTGDYFKNNGDGTFTLVTSQNSIAASPQLLADIDNDGDMDLFNGIYSGPNTVFSNDGKGVFTDTKQSLQGPDDPPYTWDAIFVDVDNDGDLDIVEAAVNNAGTIVWLNDGKGVFSDSGQKLSPGSNVRKVEAADLNGDKYPDLVFALYSDTEPNVVYLNDGTGKFSLSSQSFGDNRYSWSVAIGDLDLNGSNDIVEGNLGGGSVGAQKSRIWFNYGGDFKESVFQFPDDQVYMVRLGDVDRDGDLDVVMSTATDIKVWLNNTQ